MSRKENIEAVVFLVCYLVIVIVLLACMMSLTGCGDVTDIIVQLPDPTATPAETITPTPEFEETVIATFPVFNPVCTGVMKWEDGHKIGNVAKNGDHTGKLALLFASKWQRKFLLVEVEGRRGVWDELEYSGCPDDRNTDQDGRCRQHWRGHLKLDRYKKPTTIIRASDGVQHCEWEFKNRRGQVRAD